MGASTSRKSVAKKTATGAKKSASGRKVAKKSAARTKKYAEAGAPWWKAHLPG